MTRKSPTFIARIGRLFTAIIDQAPMNTTPIAPQQTTATNGQTITTEERP